MSPPPSPTSATPAASASKRSSKARARETEKEFTFTLQLTNAGVTLEGAYPADINGTDTTVAVDASGKATFKLKDGETITINGIPDGTTYEVLEQDYSANGYETTSTLDSGEIIDGETAQAKFTNHRDVGSLKITKEVAGQRRRRAERFDRV